MRGWRRSPSARRIPPVTHLHPRRVPPRDRNRVVGAARVDDDRFVGPATDARAAPICADSFLVMTVTVTFTERSVSQEGAAGAESPGLRAGSYVGGPLRAAAALPPRDRYELHGFEVHERSVVRDDGVQLREPGGGEIALRLEQRNVVDRPTVIASVRPRIGAQRTRAPCGWPRPASGWCRPAAPHRAPGR